MRRISLCKIAAVSCSVAACTGGFASMARASAVGWQSMSLPRLAANTLLYGVAAGSRTDAWAVGQTLSVRGRSHPRPGRTVVLHWNGDRWARQSAPSPGPASNTDFSRDDALLGVSVVSNFDAWAVGSYEPAPSHQSAMVLHWNGRRWSVALLLPAEAIFHGTSFSGVYAASASDVWAAGYHFSSSGRGPVSDTPLLYHYKGRRWMRVGVPAPRGTMLNAISGTSGRDVWAVGQYGSGMRQRSLILHFDGHRWARTRSPHGLGTSSVFGGVDAVSPSSAFAVGGSGVPFAGGEDLVAYWDGTSWQPQPTPQNTPGGTNANSSLAGVAATSPNDAWAVGETDRSAPSRSDPFGHTPFAPVILHWDGTSWQRQQTPSLGRGEHSFTAVAATAATDVWAVGNGSAPFILHCC